MPGKCLEIKMKRLRFRIQKDKMIRGIGSSTKGDAKFFQQELPPITRNPGPASPPALPMAFDVMHMARTGTHPITSAIYIPAMPRHPIAAYPNITRARS